MRLGTSDADVMTEHLLGLMLMVGRVTPKITPVS